MENTSVLDPDELLPVCVDNTGPDCLTHPEATGQASSPIMVSEPKGCGKSLFYFLQA